MQHWLFLICAILCEVVGTIAMKMSYGFTKILPSVLLFVFYGASFAMLTLALKKIDVSTAYAIWAGVGTALISLIGIVAFKESISVLKIASLLLIIGGVVGLKISGVDH